MKQFLLRNTSEREHSELVLSSEQLPQATRSFTSGAWIDYESIGSPATSTTSR